MVWPDDTTQCHAVPLNQAVEPYDRFIKPADVCFTVDEYAKIKKYAAEVLRRCGDRCE